MIKRPNKLFLPRIYQVLATAIEIMKADKGNIQFYDERKDTLRIVAHIGFNDDFLRVFEHVSLGHASCGLALTQKKRVIIEDIFQDPSFCDVGPILKTFGYISMQSTPLLDSKGKLFGVLSTHFSQKCIPDEEDFHMLDEYLRRAVPILSRKKENFEICTKRARITNKLSSQESDLLGFPG